MKKIYVFWLGFAVLAAAAFGALHFLTAQNYPSKPWGISENNTSAGVFDFEKKTGLKADLAALYVAWPEAFPMQTALSLGSQNKTILIFWEPTQTTLDDIISGNFNSYIKYFANEAKNYGGQIIIIPLEEANGNWDNWSGASKGNSPEKVVFAYRQIHDVFSSQETLNVKWGWAVNSDSVPNTPENQIANYYPGDQYVDYVGVDGFNFGDPWQSYSEIFSSALAELRKFKKPIYIFSMACAEGPKKPAWIQDALFKIRSDQSIAGFLWFDEKKEKDWRIDSDPQSLYMFAHSL